MIIRRIPNLLMQSPKRFVANRALRRRHWLYRDGVVKLDESELVIRAYYWPAGSKRMQSGPQAVSKRRLERRQTRHTHRQPAGP